MKDSTSTTGQMALTLATINMAVLKRAGLVTPEEAGQIGDLIMARDIDGMVALAQKITDDWVNDATS